MFMAARFQASFVYVPCFYIKKGFLQYSFNIILNQLESEKELQPLKSRLALNAIISFISLYLKRVLF